MLGCASWRRRWTMREFLFGVLLGLLLVVIVAAMMVAQMQ